ncbi:MAG: virulence factor [Acidimicrobiales bacterium]
MSGRRRRGGGPSLKIIMWRDIPAQVNGTSGDRKVQVELPPRFQKAIDRAAMVADKKDANSYIAEMGSESRSAVGADIDAEVADLVTEIEAEFTPERLNEFVAAGGFHPDKSEDPRNEGTSQ